MPSIEMVDPQSNPTNIKVVGVGGGGGNAINHMVEAGLKGVEFISVNTDKQALSISKADKSLVIGENITGGLGAGTDPSKGEDAAREDADKIEDALRGADLIFIASGFGGGTGTGASPVISEIAKKLGALSVGVVTKPFEGEGRIRSERAQEGIDKMLKIVDSLIVIPNENLFKILDANITLEDAYRIADDVLYKGVKGISDIITTPGMVVNVDFADVKTMMGISRGKAHMGIGKGKGPERVRQAMENAIHNPLIEVSSVQGAKGILANIVGPKDFSLKEHQEAMSLINEYADPQASIKIGTCSDDSLDDEVMITVIATGFAAEIDPKHTSKEQQVPEKKDYDFPVLRESKSEEKEEIVRRPFTPRAESKEQPAEDFAPVTNTHLTENKEEENNSNKVTSVGAFSSFVLNDSKEEEKEKDEPVYNYAAKTSAEEKSVAAKEEEENVKEEEKTKKQHALPFDVMPEDEMMLHSKRAQGEDQGSLNEDLDIPAFIRKRMEYGQNN